SRTVTSRTVINCRSRSPTRNDLHVDSMCNGVPSRLLETNWHRWDLDPTWSFAARENSHGCREGRNRASGLPFRAAGEACPKSKANDWFAYRMSPRSATAIPSGLARKAASKTLVSKDSHSAAGIGKGCRIYVRPAYQPGELESGVSCE